MKRKIKGPFLSSPHNERFRELVRKGFSRKAALVHVKMEDLSPTIEDLVFKDSLFPRMLFRTELTTTTSPAVSTQIKIEPGRKR